MGRRQKYKKSIVEEKAGRIESYHIKVTADSLRMMGCPCKRDESFKGRTLSLGHCGSIGGKERHGLTGENKQTNNVMNLRKRIPRPNG